MRVFGVLSCVMLLLVRWPRHLLWWSGSSVWVMCHRCPRLGSALGVIALLLILPILVTAMDAERELEWTMGIYCCVSIVISLVTDQCGSSSLSTGVVFFVRSTLSVFLPIFCHTLSAWVDRPPFTHPRQSH
ncbi:hypothetical protein BCR43DRAFT_363617 [Syncephalastrum racemosum]|uniref:Uncharacterized protein n=1 Tax=Syncephalastrum racemosum TaxID=13706 RepID=A0A1X2H410_SYNRA|nr:hypothetical protein BCR43DRAFT_363617 [Syncephalastrum racemosum]